MARSGSKLIVFVVLLLIAGGIGTFFVSRNLARGDIEASRELVAQLQAESQKLKRENADQGAKINELQIKLNNVQAALDAITPSKDTYYIHPNQSYIVADGRLTVGLIGSPANESVTINVNGKQQSVAVGQVIDVAVDPSTNCRVGVQSFDMFKAVLTASCPAAKPQ